MRKELLVYIPTAERDEELGVMSISKNRSCVIINSGGTKFTANRQALVAALLAIEEFDKANNSTTNESPPEAPVYQDVEYVKE